MSHLPTSWATAWTSCMKGSFQMRSSVLCWNQWISQRATVPIQYFWGLFTFPAFRNSFQLALPPTVGQSFLLAGSSPPNMDCQASTAIWANCQVGDNSSNLPIFPSFSASWLLLSSFLWVGVSSISGTGGVNQCRGFLGFHMDLGPHFDPSASLFLPLPWCHFGSCHAGMGEKPANQKPEQSCKSNVTSFLNF